jgi:hypothetical protein
MEVTSFHLPIELLANERKDSAIVTLPFSKAIISACIAKNYTPVHFQEMCVDQVE